MELKDISSQQHTDNQRDSGSQRTDKEETDTDFLQPGDKARSGRNTDNSDEHIQPDIIQYPKGRFRDSSESRMLRTQPSEDQSGDQRPATRTQADGNTSEMDRQSPHDTSEKNPEADENHIRLVCRAIGIA